MSFSPLHKGRGHISFLVQSVSRLPNKESIDFKNIQHTAICLSARTRRSLKVPPSLRLFNFVELAALLLPLLAKGSGSN